ncbi:MAG TPA: aldo/keto reductase [Candidatus Saccharimonadales bacterium]|nr:aldo/keto reductase [Candidatus Saccharimonadales bacterium]
MPGIPELRLSTGDTIPQVGFGTWQITEEAACIEAVSLALAAGYRHIDTAQLYGNEQYVGEAIRQSGIAREELFLTTKVNPLTPGPWRIKSNFERSLARLQTDYVDLLLLHFPVPPRLRSWRMLEEIHEAGTAKAIGVSNYTIRHLEGLMKHSTIKPAVNQVELHVFLQQPKLVQFCKDNDIAVEAYSPLAHGKGMDHPVLSELGSKHGKTPAQIMLRWCIEQGTVPLPKSVRQNRIRQNLDVFDFTLDEADMQSLAGLGKAKRTNFNPGLIP